MGIVGAYRTQRAMAHMRAEHAEWAKTATAGSVWYSKQPTSEWGRWNGGHGTPVHDRYEFVKEAGWPHACGWLTSGGANSWSIWFNLNGGGLTQERQITSNDLEAASEAMFDKVSAHMQKTVGRNAGYDPAWAKQVERMLAG